MLYSRHKLDRAGMDLVGSDPFKRSEAITLIGAWRETHLYVLKQLNDQLVKFFESKGIQYDISSMRIKRMVSIEAKLKNNSKNNTKLGGLQDIGGIRFVFPTIGILDNVVKELDSFAPEGFVFVRTRNYVDFPKSTGYRGAHYVYKFKSEDSKYDDVSIELQVRTKLQHAWAMAVETASLITKTTLKADTDDNEEWRGFFKLVSAIFARREMKPVHDDFREYDSRRFCTEYFRYKDEYKLTDQLMALRLANRQDLGDASKGFVVLIIDFDRKLVHLQTYTQDQETEATRQFNEIEKTISNRSQAALMVAIDKMQELQEAYPSYFLDTEHFFNALQEFDVKCQAIL